MKNTPPTSFFEEKNVYLANFSLCETIPIRVSLLLCKLKEK